MDPRIKRLKKSLLKLSEAEKTPELKEKIDMFLDILKKINDENK